MWTLVYTKMGDHISAQATRGNRRTVWQNKHNLVNYKLSNDQLGQYLDRQSHISNSNCKQLWACVPDYAKFTNILSLLIYKYFTEINQNTTNSEFDFNLNEPMAARSRVGPFDQALPGQEELEFEYHQEHDLYYLCIVPLCRVSDIKKQLRNKRKFKSLLSSNLFSFSRGQNVAYIMFGAVQEQSLLIGLKKSFTLLQYSSFPTTRVRSEFKISQPYQKLGMLIPFTQLLTVEPSIPSFRRFQANLFPPDPVYCRFLDNRWRKVSDANFQQNNDYKFKICF